MDQEEKKTIFEQFKDMITTESVVGEPIYIGDTTIIPFVDISFGFGSGDNTEKKGIGGGGGKMTPTAVLIIKGERIEVFSIRTANAGVIGLAEKVLNMAPDVIKGLKKKKTGSEAEETPAAADIKTGKETPSKPQESVPAAEPSAEETH